MQNEIGSIPAFLTLSSLTSAASAAPVSLASMNCSMKNPYDKDFHRICRAFEKKYGFYGEKLFTDKDKKESQEKGYTRCYMPDDDPIHGEENRKIMDLHSDYEKRIAEYRDKCKDEFFVLFSKYFRCLWD